MIMYGLIDNDHTCICCLLSEHDMSSCDQYIECNTVRVAIKVINDSFCSMTTVGCKVQSYVVGHGHIVGGLFRALKLAYNAVLPHCSLETLTGLGLNHIIMYYHVDHSVPSHPQ